MGGLRISLLLLLLCFGCFYDSEATLVKIIKKEPNFIPICTNETLNVITLIVCRIRTLRNSSEECSLLYRDGGDFVHQCDSRFRLKTLNHTVFLHLTSLTVADSGNYTCECSNLNGTFILHLNIKVKEFKSENPTTKVWTNFARVILPSGLIAAVFLFIIVSGITRIIHRRRLHCGCKRSETFGSSVHGSATTTDEDNSEDLYRSLQHPTSDLYQTISFGHHQMRPEATSATTRVTVNLENLEMNRSLEIYENLLNKNVSVELDKF